MLNRLVKIGLLVLVALLMRSQGAMASGMMALFIMLFTEEPDPNRDPNAQLDEAQQERQEHIEKLKELGWKPEDLPEFQGVIKDMQSERQSRQTIEQQLEELRNQNEILLGQITKKEDTLNLDIGDDDYIKAGDAKKIIQHSIKQIEARDQERTQAQRRQTMVESEEKAKAKYTADKYGEGLDYASRLQAWQRVKNKYPHLKNVMLNAKDPAEAACEFAELDPQIRLKLEERKSEEILKKMNSGRVPRGAGGGSGANLSIVQDDVDDIMSLPDEEIEARLEKLESKGR